MRGQSFLSVCVLAGLMLLPACDARSDDNAAAPQPAPGLVAPVLVAPVLVALGGPPAVQANYSAPLSIVTRDGMRHDFKIEIVREHASRNQGMMHRQSMPADAGMLFLFDDTAIRQFWMKNTLIPLDMVFIRADGAIGHIHEGAKPHDLTPVSSMGPVPAVLELNGGTARMLGLRPGDRVHQDAFGNALAQTPSKK